MSADGRWHRVKQLFDEVLERPEQDRAAFIASVAVDDPAVAAELQSLLQAYETPGPLENTAGLQDRLIPNALKDLSGSRIGPYRLQREVGRGGMGVVYLADRVEGGFHQQVAIKLAPQALLSETILDRFTAEREILAKLDHPHIARLLDGGVTPEGWPYLVMEYVEGDSITRFAAEAGLPLESRLDLLRAICEAVHYAHKNLVVHRDLKPSNIFIDTNGNIKLLDFGIAKLLASDGDATLLQTRTGGRLLTPAYASPEQFHGRLVTTASDVYSLGVIAYELLAGTHPYLLEGLTAEQVESAICDTVPTRPSAARLRVGKSEGRGGAEALSIDLDNIVMMALRKEPERRYASAAALGEDIQRYQDGLPVQARTPTATYRLHKFASRNKALVLAAASVLVVLLGAIALTSSQARIATTNAREAAAERDRAQAAAAKAARINDFLRGVLETANPAWWVDRELKGPDVTVLEALDEASRRMESELANDPEIRADIHHTLGETYTELRIQDRARDQFEAALALRQAVYEAPHPKIAESLFYLGVVEARAGNTADAERLVRQAVAMQRVRNEGNNLPFMLEFYASALRLRGDFQAALRVRQEAVVAAEERYGPRSPTALAFKLSEARARLDLGDLEGARDLVRLTRADASQSLRIQALIHARAREFSAAERTWSRADSALEPAATATFAFAVSSFEYAEEILLPQNKTAETAKLAQEAIDVLRSGAREGFEEIYAAHALGILAAAQAFDGHSVEGEQAAGRALGLLDGLGEAVQPFLWLHRRSATRALGRSLADQGRFEEAEVILLREHEDRVERGMTGSALTSALQDLVYLYEKWRKTEFATAYRDALSRTSAGGVVGAS